MNDQDNTQPLESDPNDFRPMPRNLFVGKAEQEQSNSSDDERTLTGGEQLATVVATRNSPALSNVMVPTRPRGSGKLNPEPSSSKHNEELLRKNADLERQLKDVQRFIDELKCLRSRQQALDLDSAPFNLSITAEPYQEGFKIPHLEIPADYKRLEGELDIMIPHADPFVATIHIGNHNVNKVFIDTSSSPNILYWSCFQKMQLNPASLKKYEGPIYGFDNQPVPIEGVITLPIYVGAKPWFRMASMNFLVFPTPQGVGVLKGNQKMVRIYYQDTFKKVKLVIAPKTSVSNISRISSIQLWLDDQEKMAFYVGDAIYYYVMILFGLKNASAPYQKLVQVVFKFQIDRNIEMKLNLLKCTFAVELGKFLRYVVSKKEIEVNPDKVGAVQQMEPLKTIKDVQRLTGLLAALHRFIARAAHFTLVNDQLYERATSMPLLRCLTPYKAEYVIREVHEGPFAQWGVDLLGPFTKGKEGGTHFIVAVNYFTKWIEAKPLSTMIERKIKEFLFNSILCRLFCDDYNIELTLTSVYTPQSNGQAKSTNKIILHGLKTCVLAAHSNWVDKLNKVLWSCRTTPSSATGETPFCLAYRAEVIIPVQIDLSSNRSAQHNDSNNEQLLRENLDLVEEVREMSRMRNMAYQSRVARFYNKRVRVRQFQVGNLVLRKVELTNAYSHMGKLAPN
ncbi:hypothetical protein SLEP1_g55325 [Rubroshorea leprosula]|uniref:Integrase catalytic domain-containing protein n=1 Tax=Rubroshorea leprosula TaxID=152421 RepID=A0AAV5MF14_9ROSI|nr:hypothetical protein SLEP1_g55325 [Rubroshorea leprosula]